MHYFASANVDQNREKQRNLKIWVENLNKGILKSCNIPQPLEYQHKNEEIVVRTVPCKSSDSIKK